jgi:hypothetical protein
MYNGDLPPLEHVEAYHKGEGKKERRRKEAHLAIIGYCSHQGDNHGKDGNI